MEAGLVGRDAEIGRQVGGAGRLSGNHDFTVLWIAQTVSELGSRVSMFVFPLLAYALTGSMLLAGLIEAAHLLGVAVALLPAGVVADRLDRRRVMRFASAVGVLLYGSLVAAIAVGRLTVPHLLAVAIGAGLAAGALAPAGVSAVGPVGGALYGVTRWLPFAADAASYAVSWVLQGADRVLTVLVGWSWVPLAVPLMFSNTPLTAALSLSVGIFLNPAGNSGIGAYRLHVTPPCWSAGCSR